MNAYYVAERVGTEYRGEVVDAKTHRTILVTSHNYADKTVAECAAKKMWEEAQEAIV